MDKRELKSIIEALMFIWGDPLSLDDFSEILQLDKKSIRNILHEMIDEFDYNRRGIRIIQFGDNYQMATRTEHYEWIKKLYEPKPKKSLSNAALETLSIIAYKQPITKSQIEAIRGVRCDKVIESLIERGIIEEKGKLDRTGRPIIYGTTDEFLRYFGLKKVEELPNFKELNNFE